MNPQVPQSISIPIPSTRNWLIVHIAFPLLPFFLGGIVRYIFNAEFKVSTFSCSELCLSMGIISSFISQSLWTNVDPLTNPDIEVEKGTWAQICIMFTSSFIVLFVIIELLNNLLNGKDLSILLEKRLKISLDIAQNVGFVFSLFGLILFVRIQRSFKLRAKF